MEMELSPPLNLVRPRLFLRRLGMAEEHLRYLDPEKILFKPRHLQT